MLTADLGPGKFGPPVGPECIECTVPEEELKKICTDQPSDNRKNKYLDDEYYASRVYDLGKIDVPLLSVANLGGILLHLRGNVIGYLEAGTKNKWLWLISGRCALPRQAKVPVLNSAAVMTCLSISLTSSSFRSLVRCLALSKGLLS